MIKQKITALDVAKYIIKFFHECGAWIYGPVIPKVFQKYKSNKWHPIVCNVEAIDISDKLAKHIKDLMNVVLF